MKFVTAFVLAACCFFAANAQRQKVSLIVLHAKIYTVDSAFSVEQAMAVSDGKVVAVGSDRSILKSYTADSVFYASGKIIFPGFIDAHCHLTGYAADSWKCNLYGCHSFDEVVARVQRYSVHAPVTWIYGRGWDQNIWPTREFPDKKMLDSLYPNRPVFLKRIDGHAALANQKALDLAGITAQTKIAGGEVEVKNGRLTGILVDNARDSLEKIIPGISDSLFAKYFDAAQDYAFAAGLTGVHDPGISEHTVELLQSFEQHARLRMKMFVLLSDDSNLYKSWARRGPYCSPFLHVGGFKFYADGALGSRGACLLQDYSDQPGWRGFLLNTPEHFRRAAKILAASGLQMCTHAIGDSANRLMLGIYAEVLKGPNDRRWRIEHAQIVSPEDVPMFGRYNIIPSVQPTHATSDMTWAPTRLGSSRVKSAYAYETLLNENGWAPLGTDFPVEYIDPLKTFYAAVARRDAAGHPANGFQTENGLSREEALRGMTLWAAKAAFEEREKGTLERGKAADFVILDRDIMHCTLPQVLKTNVVSTWINGRPVYTNTRFR